jgi:hypothetical protein
VVRKLLVAKGRASDMSHLFKGGTGNVQGLALVNTVYQSLISEQDNSTSADAINNPKSREALFNEAFVMVQNRLVDDGVVAKKQTVGFGTDLAETEVKPSERRYMNEQGEQAVKRDGVWHRVTQTDIDTE